MPILLFPVFHRILFIVIAEPANVAWRLVGFYGMLEQYRRQESWQFLVNLAGLSRW